VVGTSLSSEESSVDSGALCTREPGRLIGIGRRWYWFTVGFDDDLLAEAAR